MPEKPTPTQRELEVLRILWRYGEATVRQVYEEIRSHRPIVQNTVQAFLRTMEDKGFVIHRIQGRTFVYRPLFQRDQTNSRLIGRMLDRVFDGAMDQLVDSLFSIRQPSEEEIRRLEALIADAKSAQGKSFLEKGSRQ